MKNDAKKRPKHPDLLDHPETRQLAQALERRLAELPRPNVAHTHTLIAGVYRHLMEHIGGKGANPMAETTSKFVIELLAGMKPRDPVEEMLVGQMALTHARMATLTAYADQQTSIKWAAMMHEAADRAANTFRRQMLALAEYRRPPRQRNFTAIGQANIAQQQVVQNRISENGKAANEQGSTGRTETPKMLPPDAGGAAVPTGVRATRAAVAGEHGAEDSSREGTGERKRPQAR